MHMIGPGPLGVLILVLLAILLILKRLTTGSIVEKALGDPLLRLVNFFNLFFLVAVNPLAAILLIAGRLPGSDPTSLTVAPGWLLRVLEILGLVAYLSGFILMGWALFRLGRNYQLGGSEPRATDDLILSGPYAFVRHPMYTAALFIAFGLSCLTQSAACLGAFILYFGLILLLIPVEEGRLLRAYGKRYADYRRRTRRLIPLVF